MSSHITVTVCDGDGATLSVSGKVRQGKIRKATTAVSSGAKKRSVTDRRIDRRIGKLGHHRDNNRSTVNGGTRFGSVPPTPG
ncbi:hypothetical protein ZHAS_00012191 [Anopheles sinensis]|uniref:Uncharacterized protein n=1 Tax=Anopheles sinensis TaxID=74873 RepID=A0A084W239_ANOSI|nr:hypothetical protein ZHAS_00012191 [Anopheles sinensis]